MKHLHLREASKCQTHGKVFLRRGLFESTIGTILPTMSLSLLGSQPVFACGMFIPTDTAESTRQRMWQRNMHKMSKSWVWLPLRSSKSAMMTWWNDFDNPTLNHKSAESVRNAPRCIWKHKRWKLRMWVRLSVYTLPTFQSSGGSSLACCARLNFPSLVLQKKPWSSNSSQIQAFPSNRTANIWHFSHHFQIFLFFYMVIVQKRWSTVLCTDSQKLSTHFWAWPSMS